MIAHHLSTIRDAHRVMVLDKGRIVEQGRHEELLVMGNLYFRLHEMTYAPGAFRALGQSSSEKPFGYKSSIDPFPGRLNSQK